MAGVHNENTTLLCHQQTLLPAAYDVQHRKQIDFIRRCFFESVHPLPRVGEWARRETCRCVDCEYSWWWKPHTVGQATVWTLFKCLGMWMWLRGARCQAAALQTMCRNLEREKTVLPLKTKTKTYILMKHGATVAAIYLPCVCCMCVLYCCRDFCAVRQTIYDSY